MGEPRECGEIGSSLLPLLFRLNDRRLWRIALQPFGKKRHIRVVYRRNFFVASEGV
jgi:hypothetical protein